MSPASRLTAGAVRLRRGITYRSFVSETVLLDASNGAYLGLDPEGGRMLEALMALPTFEAAAAALAADGFDRHEDVIGDLHAVEDLLAEHGFLEVGGRSGRFDRDGAG